MSKKNILLIVAATLAVTLVSSLITRVRVVAAQSSTFSIKFVEKGGTLNRETLYARRLDGSTVESLVTTAPDGKEYEQRTVIDTARGAKVVIDGITESITTYPLSQKSVADYKKPSLNCVPEESNPSESTLLGYKVVRRSHQLPSPQYRRGETWLAPDLGCIIVRSLTFGQDGKGKEIQLWSKEAVSITKNNPDSTLFVIPNWPERSPSEVRTIYGKRFGVLEPVDPRFDQAYLSAQQRR